MIKHQSGAQKRKQRVIRERLQCKGQQRLENFGIVGGEKIKEKDLVTIDDPDQETANELLDVSESSPGNDVEVLNVNLVSHPSDDVG